MACWSTGATITDVDAKLKQLDEIYVSSYFLLTLLYCVIQYFILLCSK